MQKCPHTHPIIPYNNIHITILRHPYLLCIIHPLDIKQKKLKISFYFIKGNDLFATMIYPLWKDDFSYFEHQLEGIQWMLEKETKGTVVQDNVIRGGFQCDDMGLGKTIQIASVIVNHIQPNTLLLAPLAMIDTWSSVLERAGCMIYHVINKQWVPVSKEKTLYTPERFVPQRPSVYVTNYAKLIHHPSLFYSKLTSKHQKIWDRVVLDEAHQIRNPDSSTAQSAYRILSPLRWVVTGTPLVNSQKDVVSLLAFLRVPDTDTYKWQSSYWNLLPSLLLHRSMDSIRHRLHNAPPLPTTHSLVLPFTTKEEEEFYHGIQNVQSSDGWTAEHKLKQLLRLRQLSVHPQIYIDAKQRENKYYKRTWNGSSTKFDAIHSILQSEPDTPHHYLIFCQFRLEMTLLQTFLQETAGISHVFQYHGGMNATLRASTLRRSKEIKETSVMLMQLQAGGVGLNLQEYDRIIFVSPWWTSAMMDQAIARAVRMGQQKVVEVYHLALSAEKQGSQNIDTTIFSKAQQKRFLLQEIFERSSI